MIVLIILLLSFAAYYDWKYGKVPNQLVLSMYLLGIVYLFLKDKSYIIPRLEAFFFTFAVFYLFFLTNSIGAGDIKLFMAIALFVNLKMLIIILALTFFFALLKSITNMLITKKWDLKKKVKLVPYVLLSYTSCIIYFFLRGEL